MANKTKVEDFCHLCGDFAELSLEHVPPKAAFNDQKIWVARGPQIFQQHDLNLLEREQQQGGAREFTLCKPCNSRTGSWYGKAFVAWARQAVKFLQLTNGAPTLSLPYKLYPLRVIKQVLVMFCSVAGPDLVSTIPYLKTFLLNRECKYLPSDVGVHVGYSISPLSRKAGIAGILHLDAPSHQAHVVAEIAFAPFVFVLTLGSPCPDRRLVNITDFATYGYEDQRTLSLCLPVLAVDSPYPTDYRTKAEIQAALEAMRAQLG